MDKIDAKNRQEENYPSEKIEDLDHILAVLTTGPWNIMLWVSCSLVYLLMPMNMLWAAFVAPAVNHTCVPPAGAVAIDECQYRVPSDNQSVFPCTSWTYDTSEFVFTTTSQFNLVCDRAYIRPLLSSLFMTATAFGAPVGGILADRFGRRHVSLVSFVFISIINLTTPWLTSLRTILVMRFMLGFLEPVVLGSMFSLTMEVCESSMRSFVGIICGLPWGIGMMLYGLMAYWIRDWRWLQFSMSLQCIVLIPAIWWFLDESPRWLAVHGRHDQALQVLHKAERWNVAKLPCDQQLMNILKHTEQMTMGYAAAGRNRVLQWLQEVASLMSKVIRTRVLVMWALYIISIMVYYGLSLGADIFDVDPFLYMVLSGVMELPSYTVAAPIVQRWGRRLPTAVSYFASGVAILAITWIPASAVWLSMTMAMIGKLCISVAFMIIFLYVSELLPTETRSTGLGSCIVVSRVGSMVTPFIVDTLGVAVPWGPSVVFGLSSVLAGLLTLKLPETLNTPMYDTLAEMEQAARKQSSLPTDAKSSNQEKLLQEITSL